MNRLFAALLLSTTTFAGPALSFDISAMTESEKAAFGNEVREYLMQNPEVLVEAINVLEERRAASEASSDRDLVTANRDALFNDDHSWVGGNPDGDLTIVEFIDYRCGVCRRFNDEVHDLVRNDGNIRLVLKEYPILGEESTTSARFAVAVRQIAGDDAYMKAHEQLMALRGPATVEAMRKIAEQIGLDSNEVADRMQSDAVTDVLRENAQLGERMAIMGTPTFIIGDELLRGVPAIGLTQTVDLLRQDMADQG